MWFSNPHFRRSSSTFVTTLFANFSMSSVVSKAGAAGTDRISSRISRRQIIFSGGVNRMAIHRLKILRMQVSDTISLFLGRFKKNLVRSSVVNDVKTRSFLIKISNSGRN